MTTSRDTQFTRSDRIPFTIQCHFNLLITHHLLSLRDQSQSYLRAFDDVLQTQVVMRLQIKHPNHHSSLPYEIEHIHNAVKWVLQEITGSISLTATTPLVYGGVSQLGAVASSISPSFPDKSEYVKAEQLGAYFSNLSKSIVEAISRNRPPTLNYSRSSGTSQGTNQSKMQKCLICGGEHFIPDCSMNILRLASVDTTGMERLY